ncbi:MULTISPECIES: sulfotransferase [Okeania]|uniref:Sulfotransferase n=1 Tax=Okeania hirsuta TaxID=1458930 RepID=A0A3N6NR84_9CYAN|nr:MULTISPECIES: sulfotransferase [Okeania]NET13897.1 sulfotransferase [Okeania sp. SIO1H6]NES79804.1 sulfotransferase [Okeania sp. SIO1H4]NES88419.1 sulfotransferase [Okeania sp. SIO2B9]NET23069.1 sulfotransferase [Okeania sp. SIO1H5]NET79819.1 sulfotransferase [Okeania sp. SIO1F9]
MKQKIHFISGLPRSGSTLLGALLRQNPVFHAGMSSPVGGLVNRLLEAMSENNEFSVFITPEQKRALTLTIFSTFYEAQGDKEVIFDTNRLWCSKLSLIQDLFPDSKVICCVRNVAWIMDSVERLVRKNTFEVSRLFNNSGERSTVYTRTEALSQGGRLVGFAYNALKEAFYSEYSSSLLLVDYDILAQAPDKTLSLIYQFLGEEPFEHDFENVEYQADEFDNRLNTKGLHTVRSKVEFQPRQTVLPPDLFAKYDGLSFWTNPSNSLANVIVAQANPPEVNEVRS